jgi:hypothetical protein
MALLPVTVVGVGVPVAVPLVVPETVPEAAPMAVPVAVPVAVVPVALALVCAWILGTAAAAEDNEGTAAIDLTAETVVSSAAASESVANI